MVSSFAEFIFGIIFSALFQLTHMIDSNIVIKSHYNNRKALKIKKYFLKSLFYIKNVNKFLELMFLL